MITSKITQPSRDTDPPRDRRVPPHRSDPGELALKLTGRDYLSHSAISTYQRCPLRYYFAYISDLEPAFKASSLIFGGAIHSALEHHCRALLEGNDPPDLDALVAAYEESWKPDAKSTIRYGKTESVESLRDLASRMLAAFQASEVSKLDTSVVGIEEEFRAPIIDRCPDLLGRVDLVNLTTDAVRIVDFKTSRSRWSRSKVEEAAPQMLLYAELVKPLAESCGRPIRIEWIVITKTKQPSVETHVLQYEPRQVERIKTIVRRVWQAISRGHFYPAPSSMNCSGCPYSEACRNWEG